MVLKENIEDNLEKMSNEEAMTQAVVNKKLLCEIRAKQFRFFGHVLRKESLENLVMTKRLKRKVRN